MSMSTPRIAIFAAIKLEFDAVSAALPRSAGENALVLRGGMGPEAVTRTLRTLLETPEPPRLICSTGFCGGLVDGLGVGDAVLADTLLDGRPAPAQPLRIEPPLVEKLAAALGARHVRHRVGPVISVHPAVTRCESKRALAAASAAVAVDMESFALASNLDPRRTRLAVLRVVSDSVADELPPEVKDFLDSNGDVRLASVTAFGLRSPRNMKILWELKARSGQAAAALTAAWRALWPALEKEIRA